MQQMLITEGRLQALYERQLAAMQDSGRRASGLQATHSQAAERRTGALPPIEVANLHCLACMKPSSALRLFLWATYVLVHHPSCWD